MTDVTNIIAIDGPPGAGKSSVGREVARQMGYQFLDTGAMYRAATWWAMHNGVDLDNPDSTAASTRAMPLEMHDESGRLKVVVDGHDISEAIRSQEVTQNIYKLDQVAEVREHLVELQRRIGAQAPTVCEGRDMGTVVFPKAKCKIYLDASLDARTLRRQKELEAKGQPIDFETLRAQIHERGEMSRTRKVAPLRPADDAVFLDTSDKTFEEVVTEIIRLARACL
ncbi:MAG: (d)CMP kinase [FCB group bacterium]|jgi:cytidylate kinase|nr:(d)CMP kinase [FCB group bacterium]